MAHTAKNLLVGTLAGVAAAIPMTWAMEVMHQLLPKHESYPLPPRQITDRVTQSLGLQGRLSEKQQLWLSVASHLGFGATVGAIYAPLAKRVSMPPLVKGTLFGLIVWVCSYLGFVPALGILTPATRHPPRRNAVMILAHVVWGSAVGLFTNLMESKAKREHLEFMGARHGVRSRETKHA